MREPVNPTKKVRAVIRLCRYDFSDCGGTSSALTWDSEFFFEVRADIRDGGYGFFVHNNHYIYKCAAAQAFYRNITRRARIKSEFYGFLQ